MEQCATKGVEASGEESTMEQCTLKSLKAATAVEREATVLAAQAAKQAEEADQAKAAAGGGPLKEGSIKRKAAAGSSEGEKSAAVSAAAAGGVAEGEKHTADVTPAAAAEADSGGTEGGLRLSQAYVDYILSWKPEVVEDPDEYYARMTNDPLKCFSQEYIEKSTEILRDLAEMTKRNGERFAKFQAWARAEFEEKGYVEVDDDYIARRVLLRKFIEEEDWGDTFESIDGLEFKSDDEEDGCNTRTN